MIIIGDVHGCYDTLVALLDKLPDDDVCFVGDLIDRGPKSKDVVELVKNGDYFCVLGNHEDMAIDQTIRWKSESHHPRYFQDMWLNNGGITAIESYGEDPDL